MNIKDYLHLYLGCDVELQNGNSKVYNRKLVAVGGVDDMPYCQLRIANGFVHAVLLEESRVKPILRPLSDMTEEEKKDIFGSVWMFVNIPQVEGYTPDQFIKCLKYKFDLFGLIEAGLAIDASKNEPKASKEA